MVIRVTIVTAVDKLASLFISTYNLPIHVAHNNIKRRGMIFLHIHNISELLLGGEQVHMGMETSLSAIEGTALVLLSVEEAIAACYGVERGIGCDWWHGQRLGGAVH